MSFLQWESGPASINSALAYSLASSTAFVGSLYLLVPSRVQKLPRNDSRQIQWRTLATGLVCVASAIAFPMCFPTTTTTTPTYNSPELLSSIYATASASAGVLTHVAILYLGPLMQGFMAIHDHLSRIRANNKSHPLNINAYVKAWYQAFIEPITSSMATNKEVLWIQLRNLVIAPFTEEFVFRGCIVSALAAVSEPNPLSVGSISWIAPLFFGVAHIHHAMRRLHVDGEALFPTVIVQTLFQFAYTTLFGAYSSFAYLRTKSLVAVVVSHSFCNYMGLPSLSFLASASPIHRYRGVLGLAHVIGLIAFLMEIKLAVLLPRAD